MHKGISLWLDIPIELLAQRIAAVGTNSRPLLHYHAGDAYTQVNFFFFSFFPFFAMLGVFFLYVRGISSFTVIDIINYQDNKGKHPILS